MFSYKLIVEHFYKVIDKTIIQYLCVLILILELVGWVASIDLQENKKLINSPSSA